MRRTLGWKLGPLAAACAALAAVAPRVASAQGLADLNSTWVSEPQRGRAFTAPEIDILADLHGDIADPQLTVFYGGSQFMVLPDLLRAFRERHPEHVRIFVETLPPGILADQIDQIDQGAVVIGNLRAAVQPDVYIAGRETIERMQREAGRFAETRPVNRNRLTLMVPAGNPAGVRGIADPGRPGLCVAMPNPAWEGIGHQLQSVYRRAGGDALERRIMTEKVADGTTVLTEIHHRQTPLRLLRGTSDVGTVWEGEFAYQRRHGRPLEAVAIPDALNHTGTTVAAVLRDAPHPQAARDFVACLGGERAQAVFREHGFLPPE